MTAWKSRDAAACIALISLLPESEETHFTQVRTASEFLTAIKARYATPTTVSLGRLFLPFLFPDLASFERAADLITHLRSLDSSYRAACTDAQLALLPPPMAITIYFIATNLPECLASVRDALLLKHPSELTIEVLESALKDVESNLRSVASASGVVPPPLFHGCTIPQLPTFTASLTTAATDMTAYAVTTSSRSRGRSGRRGGQGAGGGGGGGGGDVASGIGGSASAGGVPRVAAGDSPAAAGGGDARVSAAPPLTVATAATAAAAGFGARVRTGSGQRQLQRGVVHPPCTYHVMTGARRSQPCGRSHPSCQCFAHLTDTVRLAYGVDGLVQTFGPALLGMSASQLVYLFGTPHAMYAVVDSSASDSVYSSVVSLGASLAEVPIASVGTCVDTSPGANPEDASLSFTLDSGASHSFFSDRTTLTPLPTPVSVALADPTSGPVTACYTTTLPCPAVPSGYLTGFHVPSFSRNLVGVRPLVSQHVSVWIEPSRKTAVCVDGDTYVPLATFTAEPGSGLHTSHWPPWAAAAATAPDPCHCPPSGSCVSPGCRISPGSCVWSGLVMEIARTSMTHAHAPHFLWPYAVRYAAHQLNLWPRVSRPEVSPTSLWTRSPGAVSRFRVWGCLALVRDTSVDKISPCDVSCVFLGFPKDSSDYTFYHPPLHRFFDSCDVLFDEYVPYYVRYPCQGLPVPPAPLFPTSAPPPAPPVQPPPPGPAPSGVSHATPPPSVAPQVQPPSPQSSSQPTADPAGAGFCGEDPGGASSRGAGVGAESVPVRGPGSGGAGVGAEPVAAGDSSLWGAGVSGAVLGGATTGGAPSAGPGEPGMDPVTSGGAGSGGGATGSLDLVFGAADC
ncbi:unnamed protein product [Closterium sp. NIES-54]